MKNYLEHIGDILIQQIMEHKEPVLILPNKRPVAYLQRYISSQLKKALWFPKVYTIEEFVSELSAMQLANPNYIACCLYDIYVETMQDQSDSFDDFLKWWTMVISDFNDIDMYMVEADMLFNYVNEAKAIEQWNPGQSTPTKLQQQYLSFWKYLPVFYQKLNAKLSSDHIGYRGMLYRKAAEKIQENIRGYSDQTFYFAGFNALSTSEEKIIECFLKEKKGYIYWEADDYYLEDSNQEAGTFMRHYKKHWQQYDNSIFYCNNLLLTDDKQIYISGAPKSMLQASLAGGLLKEILEKHENKNKQSTINNSINAALIPADESQLNPLLYQLPEEHIKKINISMGYPLLSLPLNGLYELVFEIINQLEKDKPVLFNANLLHRFFSHPYVPLLSSKGDLKEATYDILLLKKKLSGSGKILYDLKGIQQLERDFKHIEFSWLFDAVVEVNAHLKLLLSLLFKINDKLGTSKGLHDYHHQLLIYQLGAYNPILDDTASIFFREDYTIIKQTKTLLLLIKQALQSSSLPFIGNATGGFQFIGLLETRMLQFDEMIITGCNESILPNAKASGNSFIPFDIRSYFKLPTYKDSEAVFAYHFYRLLQGAKKIHLIYNTETDEFGSGEKSRFLSQIEMEMIIKNPRTTVHQSIIRLPDLSNFQRKSISFEHKNYLDKIKRLLQEKGLSATALISYKNCSLQFYFKYIERIKEPDEIADEVGANIVGSVIHKVLEEIYTPLKLKKLHVKDISHSAALIEQMTVKAFEAIAPGVDASSGKNLLFIQTAVRIVLKYLSSEKEQLIAGEQIEVLHTEAPFEKTMMVHQTAVKLIGNIDRIDLFNEYLRIIDYKTGSVTASKLKIEAPDNFLVPYEYDKAFQLMYYRLLFANQTRANQKVISGILSLRKISEGLHAVSYKEDDNEMLLAFEQMIKNLISKLLDDKVNFEQTIDSRVCNYCAYNNICMK